MFDFKQTLLVLQGGSSDGIIQPVMDLVGLALGEHELVNEVG